MRGFSNQRNNKNYFLNTFQKMSIYIASLLVLFFFISFLTTMKPSYRFTSKAINKFTSEVESDAFLYLLGMENRIFKRVVNNEETSLFLPQNLFKMATNLDFYNHQSLFGYELPGFTTDGHEIIIAGKNAHYGDLSFESSPPLADVLRERKAIFDDGSDEEEETQQDSKEQKVDEKVVFIYNTHNRESFLPHLPDVKEPNLAHHDEVNITKVSEYFAESLEEKGIGTEIDLTDHMHVLKTNDWSYGQAYQASRQVITEVLAENDNIQYMFDIHRDSLKRDHTTINIDGKDYAKVMMVIGEEHDQYENNLKLATTLHELIENKYSGLSRGVITKKGPGNNGIYNQDLLENAVLIEFGGYENTLEELYRTADIFTEIFSDYYWDAEKVSTQ